MWCHQKMPIIKVTEKIKNEVLNIIINWKYLWKNIIKKRIDFVRHILHHEGLLKLIIERDRYFFSLLSEDICWLHSVVASTQNRVNFVYELVTWNNTKGLYILSIFQNYLIILLSCRFKDKVLSIPWFILHCVKNTACRDSYLLIYDFWK